MNISARGKKADFLLKKGSSMVGNPNYYPADGNCDWPRMDSRHWEGGWCNNPREERKKKKK